MQISLIIGSCLLAFSLSVAGLYFLIPILRKFRAGQNILSYVVEHKGKSGTPTMGGVAFICSAIATTLIFAEELDRTLIVSLVIGGAYMIIGLLDDGLKLKNKQNLGLSALQKLIFQIAVALLASIYAIKSGTTQINIPFLNFPLELGYWIFPLGVFVFLATVNCVNLTDGLDGLAGGSCVPVFLFFGTLLGIQENITLSLLSFSLAAALLGYLCFNSYPASVFMGDTGSLALGGFISCIALFSGNLLYIATVGVVFVLSGLSVILQVCYFKLTKGKRIFKMTPIHHHFQQCGFSETKIAYVYFVATLILALVNLAFII